MKARELTTTILELGRGRRCQIVAPIEKEEIITILRKLPRRRQLVIIARFGLYGVTPKTLIKIANHCKITSERIRQIEARTLNELHRLIYKTRRGNNDS